MLISLYLSEVRGRTQNSSSGMLKQGQCECVGAYRKHSSS